MPYFEDESNIYLDFKGEVKLKGLRVGYVLSKLMAAYMKNPDIIGKE
jgi:hypothetical protein